MKRHAKTVLAFSAARDYIGYMYKTLRESKATLSALVERACGGEEVVITVRGRPRVRLCPVEDDRRFSSPDFVRELESIQSRYRVSAVEVASRTGSYKTPVSQIGNQPPLRIFRNYACLVSQKPSEVVG